MSTPPKRSSRLFPVITGVATLASVALAIRAFSDVPRGGVPFVSAQNADGAPTTSPSNEEWLTRASHAFNEIAREAMPAVVAVSTIRKIPAHPSLVPNMPPPGLPPMLGGGGGDPAAADPRMLGIGSGILIRKDGLVLTNSHVVEDAEKVTVIFDEKHKNKAHVVGIDPKTDLAVIKIDGPKRDYPVIGFGDSDQLHEGDWAIAIGAPFGLNRSLSFGIISAKGRAQMGILDVEDFIQTDAAINPGSSGGPLLNAKGELVGVNTAIFSEGGGNMGIGFAIPSKIAKEISEAIIAQGRVPRGWVGMMAQDLDSDLARYFKVSGTRGALVSEVLPEGPAGLAQIRSGDVITQYDQHPIDTASTLKSLVGKSKAGARIPIDFVRDGKTATAQLTIREQPRPPGAQLAGRAAVPSPGKNKAPPSFGLAVEDVPQEISRILRLPKRDGTLVVGVNPGSPAFEAGLGPGDVILNANRTAVHGAHEFNKLSREILEKSERADVAVLYVQRGPTERIYVPIRLNEPAA